MLKNQIRIIGGKWRGRKIQVTDIPGLRPTPDRIRETLFNWLLPELQNARCLDLFAGTGVLGLEALSRGAQKVVFLEKDKNVFQTLEKTLESLKAEKDCFEILNMDALAWLSDVNIQKKHGAFDIVFIDPPYALDLLASTFLQLDKGAWITNHGLIYFESNHPIEGSILPKTWEILKEKKAGLVHYYLARNHSPFGES